MPRVTPDPHSPGWSPWSLGVLAAVACFWLVIAVLSAASTAAIAARSVAASAERFGVALGEAVLACAVFALLTPFALRAGQRWSFGGRRRRGAVAIHLVFAMLYWVSSSSALVLLTRVLTGGSATIGSVAASSAFAALLAYLVTVGAAHFVDTWQRLRVEERRRASMALELSRAQFQALTGHLRPHFLFNALNGIATLIGRDNAAASRAVLDLAHLLRLSLERSHETEVTLADEIAVCRAYLSIMALRVGDRLRVRWETPDDVLAARVPQLLVLPLVENAMKHGIMRDEDAGVLTIEARRADDQLVIAVTDDGPGPPVDVVEGFGLQISRTRLERHYGRGYELCLTTHAPRGARASVRLPLHSE